MQQLVKNQRIQLVHRDS